ncbi:MAG: cytochrome c1 [Formosimonas sp.]
MLTHYFPLFVYLTIGAFILAVVGATFVMLAHGNGAEKNADAQKKLTIATAVGVLLGAFAGYKITGAYGYASLAVLGALVYALGFWLGVSLASKSGVRKTLLKALYGLFGVSVLGIAYLMFFGGHGGIENKHAKIDVTDKVSLQRGAAVFRDYCLSCHGLSMVRYNQLTKIGLTEDDIRLNMLTTADKIGETMQVAMKREDAKKWLGVAPPDLSLEAAAKKPDWIYSYLTGFYKDESRPTGWNNIYFENVGMPHALWQEEGVKEAIFKEEPDHNDPSKTVKVFDKFTEAKGGKLDKEAFERTASDVTNFLVWASEPDQHSRKMIGFGVLAFLLVLLVFVRKLNKNYWKDIH